MVIQMVLFRLKFYHQTVLWLFLLFLLLLEFYHPLVLVLLLLEF